MKTLKVIIKELFNTSLILYIFVLLIEVIREGSVSNFIDTNVFLGVLILLGLLSLGMNKGAFESKGGESIKEWEVYLSIVLSISCGYVVFYKTSELGVLSYLISLISCTIVLIFSYLIFSEE